MSNDQHQRLPYYRFNISQAAQILDLSRAALYERIKEKKIALQKDGRRSFIMQEEIRRYLASLDNSNCERTVD